MVVARLVFPSVLVGLLTTPVLRIEGPAHGPDTLESGQPALVVAGSVSVAPANGTDSQLRLENTAGYTSDTFTVTNNGTMDTRYSSSCTRTGAVAVITTCPAITGILIPGQVRKVVITFTTGNQGAGTVQLTVTPTQPAGTAQTGKYNVTVVGKGVVTPDGAVRRDPSGTTTSFVFNVKNTGTTGSTTYTIDPICSGGVIDDATSCQPSPATLPVAAGATGTVTVNYRVAAGPTTGLIEVKAKVGSIVHDSGTLNVTVAPAPPPPPPPGISVSQNPGNLVARGQCLTIALASASASECGDLRIVHPLPSVRTMNRGRTPTLVYNSAHALGWVSVAADLTLPTANSPTGVSAELKIHNAQRASGSWSGNQFPAGSTRRISLGFSAPSQSLATGVYDYELIVTTIYPAPTAPFIASTTGKLAIVDRSSSYFGAGWWLAGLERWDEATAVWIGGDGSVRQYVLRPGSVFPNRVWGAPSVTYPDSIRELNGKFVRQLPDSVWVFFGASGLHDSTRNAQGHVTKFVYDQASTRLTTIIVPPASAPLSYTLSYPNANTIQVVAPGDPSSRTTTITLSNNRVTRIDEPDTRFVTFEYGTDSKITARIDRRSTRTDFSYDPGNRVSGSVINMQPGAITRTLVQSPSQGFQPTAVALSDVYTRLDGPRIPENTAKFYLNRFGAPDTIIDALGQRAWLVRNDPTFLGLVTQVSGVTGHTATAVYDSRGRITSMNAPTTTGFIATTSFVWDAKWDQVTRITKPEQDFVQFGIDAGSGNRMWQEDGRGSTTRVNFTYNAANQVFTVTPPTSGAHTYTYDAKGNLNTYTSALGRLHTWTNNNIGLSTLIQTPVGVSTQTGWGPTQDDAIGYSVRNEETSRTTTGWDNASITVTNTFDEEGNRLTTTRTFSPTGIPPLTTTWEYDRANRQRKQIEPGGGNQRRGFDAAGNLVADTTRRGYVISMTYDALNRLVTRSLPEVIYAPWSSQFQPGQGSIEQFGYTWSADNQTFEYSADGRITLATNKDATVKRTYHAGGSLLTDTLRIKNWNRASGDHPYGITYSYDRNGRRLTLAAPAAFAGDLIRYEYSPSWGALTKVRDIGNNAFTLNYNDLGEVSRIDYGGSIYKYFGYDGDGRQNSDFIQNGGSQVFPFYPSGTIRDFDVIQRNARGQILESEDATLADQVKATYSGLGYLLTSNLHQRVIGIPSGLPAEYGSGETYSYDGLGNIVTSLFTDTTYASGSTTITAKNGANSYTDQGADVGRLYQHLENANLTTYLYDPSGNTYFESMAPGMYVEHERAAYYAPDEKIVGSDTRDVLRIRTFEEYRYDALGRRVWVRSIKKCEPSSQHVSCNTPYVRRVIWDGAQELAEIQSPVDPDNPGTIEELDTGYPERSWGFSPEDPNPFYGRVVYGPGLDIDQPLSATRYEYRDKPGINASSLTWPRFTWQIFWNYQGRPAYGTLTTGAWANPYQLGVNQQSCPIVGDQSTQRCVLVQWPWARSAYNQNHGNVPYPSWHGALMEGKRDRSGLEYKRNRQYDPATGRFTQEDPIGLAGGLNVYGFAAGDPVNFADPFGLRPLTAAERAKLGDMCKTIDCNKVQVFEGNEDKQANALRAFWLKASGGRSITVGNNIIVSDADLSRGTIKGQVLAHEMTHVGQLQSWGPLAYGFIGLVTQGVNSMGYDQYQVLPPPTMKWEQYGMEQQATIVETCYAGLQSYCRVSPYSFSPR